MELEVSQVSYIQRIGFCFQKKGIVAGKMDDVLIWEAGPEGAGVYVGKLNGRPITGVAMIQHNQSYAWVSLYIISVKKSIVARASYSFKTWKVARASLNPGTNLGLDTVVSAASLYEREGFKRAWITTFCYFSVSSILEAYKNLAMPDGVTIKPATNVDFQKLKWYVEDIIGITFARNGFLEKWITSQH